MVTPPAQAVPVAAEASIPDSKPPTVPQAEAAKDVPMRPVSDCRVESWWRLALVASSHTLVQ